MTEHFKLAVGIACITCVTSLWAGMTCLVLLGAIAWWLRPCAGWHTVFSGPAEGMGLVCFLIFFLDFFSFFLWT